MLSQGREDDLDVLIASHHELVEEEEEAAKGCERTTVSTYARVELSLVSYFDLPAKNNCLDSRLSDMEGYRG